MHVFLYRFLKLSPEWSGGLYQVVVLSFWLVVGFKYAIKECINIFKKLCVCIVYVFSYNNTFELLSMFRVEIVY